MVVPCHVMSYKALQGYMDPATYTLRSEMQHFVTLEYETVHLHGVASRIGAADTQVTLQPYRLEA